MWKRLRKLARKLPGRLTVSVLRRIEQWNQDDLPQFSTTPRNLTIMMPRMVCRPEASIHWQRCMALAGFTAGAGNAFSWPAALAGQHATDLLNSDLNQKS